MNVVNLKKRQSKSFLKRCWTEYWYLIKSYLEPCL